MHSVDDASAGIVNSTFASNCLSRYSFLFRSKEVNDEPVAKLIEAITLQVNALATWVSAWDDRSGELHTPIRAKVEALRLRKAGYEIYEETETVSSTQLSLGVRPKLFIAMTKADTFRHQNGNPIDFFTAFGRDFLVLGVIPPLSMFINHSTRATMSALARRHCLTPSDHFLEWIEEHQLSLLYQEADIHENGHFVLIAVTPKALDLEELLDARIVDEVRTLRMS